MCVLTKWLKIIYRRDWQLNKGIEYSRAKSRISHRRPSRYYFLIVCVARRTLFDVKFVRLDGKNLGYQRLNNCQPKVLEEFNWPFARQRKRLAQRCMVSWQSVCKLWLCRQVCIHLGYQHEKDSPEAWWTYRDSEPNRHEFHQQKKLSGFMQQWQNNNNQRNARHFFMIFLKLLLSQK